MKFKRLILIVFLGMIIISHTHAGAGEPPPPDAAGVVRTPPEADNLLFISSEFEMEKFVKGAPYSAQAVTERVQDLADGNRITQRNTANVYRDSEGRTRREQELALIGPWTSSADEPVRTVFIHDAASGVDYILDDAEKTARKMKVPANAKPRTAHEDKLFQEPLLPPRIAGGPHLIQFYKEQLNGKTELLGKQTMDGISVEGTRTTSVIPAGKIGNERPVEIVSEKWFSPELQVYIMTRHSDPRFGETTYRLTNISRREPDANLFQVPEGYKVIDAPGPGKMMFKREKID